MTVRVVFLGNDPWSVPPLEALVRAGGIEVALVVTRGPKPAGRGSTLTPTKVAEAAGALVLPLLETETVRSGAGLAALRDARPDSLVVVAYGEILTPEVLAVAVPVNLHFSLLPRWRGAAPVQRALLAGDDVTGVTVMRMDEGLDTGPVLAQIEDPIRPQDDAGSLGARLADVGGSILAETLRRLTAIDPEPQDDALATLAPKLSTDERLIDWSMPARAIERRVRALAPEPGASTRFRGGVFKVLRVRAEVDATSGEPGSIGHPRRDGVPVAAGDGIVVLLDVAPAGRKRMPASDWARGARLGSDERFT